MISYNEWRENEAPKQTYHVLNIMTEVEKYQSQQTAPVVVMCRYQLSSILITYINKQTNNIKYYFCLRP